ncbi:MAG: imidazoleglycerol-phosphate dehydratase HisB [Thermodesulfobacteriota bacterium]|nr:imidazoleglycerol-phosphate dehydratase HisB [Thermodesulfobacteriota bacterium]
MERKAQVKRVTKETDVQIEINLDGSGKTEVTTRIPFFDHMLTLFGVHGFFDLNLKVSGDIDVDFHHTVEDTGLVLGQAISDALGDRKGVSRYGCGEVPMDEAFSKVNIDLSNRPYLVYHLPEIIRVQGPFDAYLAKEFFRALAVQAGMNLHINTAYGENEHHILESIFKATGRALKAACFLDPGITAVLSSKGSL